MSSPLTAVRVGAVAALRRFPLRSAGGEEPAAARLEAGGLQHDRRWQLVGPDGTPVHRREAAGLAALRATVGAGGELLLQDGRGTPLDAGDAARSLAGPGARLADADAGDPGVRHREGAALHLVSDRVAQAPGAAEALAGGCDPGERANVVVALDPDLAAGVAAALGLVPGASAPGPAGRRLAVGGAVVELTRAPRRCLGVYAAVVVPGPVAVGDGVLLLDGA